MVILNKQSTRVIELQAELATFYRIQFLLGRTTDKQWLFSPSYLAGIFFLK